MKAEPLAATTDPFGGKALCSSVTLTNTTAESQDYNALYFKVQTPSGDVSSTSVMSAATTLASGTLITGATKTGLLCTDDKGEKGVYVVIYKPNSFKADRGVWLSTV